MSRRKHQLIITLGLVCFFVSCRGQDNLESDRHELASPSPTSTPTPTPKPMPHPAAVSALKSLRKMAGATEIGLSLQEYSSRMIDLKAEVDESLAELPESEGKREISLALQAYVDAKIIWNEASGDYVFTMFEPAKSLRNKYRIPEETKGQMTYKRVALSTIWTSANRHIQNASKSLLEVPK